MLDITDLPPQIVPAVNAFAQRLSSHIGAHRDASLEAHEQGVLEAWRAEGAAVLGGVVSAATTGADPAAPTAECLSAVWAWASSRAMASAYAGDATGRPDVHSNALTAARCVI